MEEATGIIFSDGQLDELVEVLAPEGVDTTETSDLVTLCKKLKAKRDHKADLAEQTKATNAEIDDLETQITAEFLRLECTNITVGGFQYVYTFKPRARILNMAKVVAWCRRHGRKDVVQTVVNDKTFSGICNQWREEGVEIPKTLAAHISIYDDPTISVRKAAKKARVAKGVN